eukprot:4879207-Prymnesium_polylepis.1
MQPRAVRGENSMWRPSPCYFKLAARPVASFTAGGAAGPVAGGQPVNIVNNLYTATSSTAERSRITGW